MIDRFFSSGCSDTYREGPAANGLAYRNGINDFIFFLCVIEGEAQGGNVGIYTEGRVHYMFGIALE